MFASLIKSCFNSEESKNQSARPGNTVRDGDYWSANKMKSELIWMISIKNPDPVPLPPCKKFTSLLSCLIIFIQFAKSIVTFHPVRINTKRLCPDINSSENTWINSTYCLMGTVDAISFAGLQYWAKRHFHCTRVMKKSQEPQLRLAWEHSNAHLAILENEWCHNYVWCTSV